MTVNEMIIELEKLPKDAKIVIEGYMKGCDGCDGCDESVNGLLNPEMIEGIKNEVYGIRVVIWASIVTEPNK